MTTSELPRRNPGASGPTYTPPGAPSLALRKRAAIGWEKFMRRSEPRQETKT